MDKRNKFEDHHTKYMQGVRRRREEIVRLREISWTLKEIGEKFDISAERVRQILLSASKEKAAKIAAEAVDE
jgi:DNA-directed RNA polymerase sigma subunit (sigma70/sigma32)